MENYQDKKRSFIDDVREVVRVLVISLLVVIPIRIFVAQPFIVRGASMEPSFEDGEYLIVDQISYRLRTPERGQTIIFHYPVDPKQFFIKRIVGLPGETVIIENGDVFIKNKKNPEGFKLSEPYIDSGITKPDSVITLGPRDYYVLGDNRKNSSDSRFWGVLDKKYIVGKAFIRLWPPAHLSVL